MSPYAALALSGDTKTASDILDKWGADVFVMEIKKCGEVLQCHQCRAVCHKYGNDNQCRFLVPHEIVEASHFDPENNTVIFVCHDAIVNYFNPYLLVFCRHNHDLKCILSGKGAKAAVKTMHKYGI
ncbi:hypothetical protein BDR06DRAFT_870183 [Suillus hirtellus]|nr:hypothetical protein BDR06DRAFT_870183 [Suillus hirtellus]